jgi:hypothetical protein
VHIIFKAVPFYSHTPLSVAILLIKALLQTPSCNLSKWNCCDKTDWHLDWLKAQEHILSPLKMFKFLDYYSLCQRWIFPSCSSWVAFHWTRHLYIQMHMHACMQFTSELSCRIIWYVSCDKPMILVTSWIICLWSSWMTFKHGQWSTAYKSQLLL